MNILLVCSAGMSTSLLVAKMRSAAEEQGLDVTIDARSASELGDHLNGKDVVLLGPQVRYMLDQIKKQVAGTNVAVDVIQPMHYGMMNGKAVIEQAYSLVKQNA